MKLRTVTAAGIVGLLVLAGCSSTDDDAAAPAESSTSASAMATPSETAAAAGTIVDVASGNADFSTLVAAVGAAGLAETLAGEGPYTVFVPTNEAFEKLPAGLVDSLLEPENKDALTRILTYHVLAGKVTSDQVSAGDVETVEGSKVAISTDGGVKVGDAMVVTPDVAASNGVIHVIDTVLVPADLDLSGL